MNTNLIVKSVSLMLLAGALGTGCVARVRYAGPAPVAEVEVAGAPPAPYMEAQPVAPGPDVVWVGGEWVWEGRWVWHRGYWGHPPRRGAVWVHGGYAFRGGRHVYVRGYWR